MQPLQFQRQWYFLLDTLSSGNYCKRVIAFIEAGWQFIDLPCFQEKKSIRPTFSAERIFGGALLAMCSNDFICFYDWAECRLIRRIDVNVKVSNKLSLKGLTQMLHNHLSTSAEVIDCCFLAIQNLYWADSGDLVSIASDTSFYILKYNVRMLSPLMLSYPVVWMWGKQVQKTVRFANLNCGQFFFYPFLFSFFFWMYFFPILSPHPKDPYIHVSPF